MRSSDNSDDRIMRETLSYNNPCPSSPSSTRYIYIYRPDIIAFRLEQLPRCEPSTLQPYFTAMFAW